MKKALIKKSGEILDVVSEYSMVQMEINFPLDFPLELSDKIKSEWTFATEDSKLKMKTNKQREDYYTLSDGETYEIDELVVGLEEIREWKINNNLEI